MSLCKQNFHATTEDGLNKQINLELQSSHTYLSIASYFGRDSLALFGLQKFFAKSSKEEREHAEKLIEYMNKRGGKVVLQQLSAPETEWKSARNALEVALQLEKDVNTSLLQLHKIGEAQNDSQFCDFLESEFLQEQVESLKELSDMVTNLARVGNDGLGLFLFDKELSEKL